MGKTKKYGVQNMQARLRLHNRKYCKYILKASSNTCSAAVSGELGRHNLYVHYFCKNVTFWLFIVQDNAPRLRNYFYHMLKGLDDVDRHTWAS